MSKEQEFSETNYNVGADEKCYVCKNVFDDKNTRRHDEHIIQNAIGGKVTSNNILCEDCGRELGSSIDTPFITELAIFNILHNTSRDRENGRSSARVDVLTKMKPECLSESTTFRLCEDYRVLPDRPIFFRDEENKIITIVASSLKQAKDFSKSKTIRQLMEAGYSIRQEADVGNYAEKFVFNVDSHSTAIVRGVSKIALEFALHSGVERYFLQDFIDALLDCSRVEKIQKLVMQYYPTTDEEKIYEINKHGHEDWYPNHQLTLFSDKGSLYCYVELFGSIQKYIHLSSRYAGKNILVRFTQRVNSWDFNPTDWTGGPKDLHIFACQFGVSLEDRSWEDIERDIAHHARIRSYTLDPEIQVNKVKVIMQSLIYYIISSIKGFSVVDELLKKSVTADQKFGISIIKSLKDNPLDAMRHMQKSYLNFRVMSNWDCCPNLVKKIDQEELDNYARFKLYESLCSVGKEENFSIYEPQTQIDGFVI